MSETKNSNASIPIWVAIIGLIGAVTVGILNNLDKFHGPKPVPTPMDTTVSRPNKLPDNPRAIAKQHQSIIPPIENKLINSEVTGQVVDEGGRGVTGSKVRCTDCLTADNVAITREDGTFTLPFQVKDRGDAIQQIHLSVSSRKDLYPVTAKDPHNQLLRPR